MTNTTLDPKQDTKTKRPKMYKVVILNDDFTEFDFVVWLLMNVFHKDMMEAIGVATDVHHDGKGIAGIYTLEVAETKSIEAMNESRANQFPLLVVVEEE